MSLSRRKVLVQLSALAVTACAGSDPGVKGPGAKDSGAAGGGDGADGGGDGSDGADGGLDTADTADPTPEWPVECDAAGQPLPADCSRATPFQSEGPFLRGDVPLRQELNVTGDSGEPMVLSGRVLDAACAPVEGVEIIVWMAGGEERFYDTESAEANLYGRQITDADGAYCFYTLKPTPYGPEGNTLPAHIHVAIVKDGSRLLTTQLYFDGDIYLAELDFPPPPELITAPEARPGGWLKLHFDFVLPPGPPPS